MQNKKRLAVIPARGGSKRIPRKNIRDFCGRPAILRVIETLKLTGLFHEIHVSTEDDEIFNLVSAAGHQPLFRRTEALSGDHTPVGSVLDYVITNYSLQGATFDTVALVFATALMLKPDELKNAIFEFEKLPESAEMLSISRYPVPVEWSYDISPGGRITARDGSQMATRSQDLREAYYENGQFVLYNWVALEAAVPSVEKQLYGFELSKLALDIDNEDDWALAEKLFNTK